MICALDSQFREGRPASESPRPQEGPGSKDVGARGQEACAAEPRTHPQLPEEESKGPDHIPSPALPGSLGLEPVLAPRGGLWFQLPPFVAQQVPGSGCAYQFHPHPR